MICRISCYWFILEIKGSFWSGCGKEILDLGAYLSLGWVTCRVFGFAYVVLSDCDVVFFCGMGMSCSCERWTSTFVKLFRVGFSLVSVSLLLLLL